MTPAPMTDQQKLNAFRAAQFVVGCILLGAELYIHAYQKELHVLILALPFALLGVDPTRFIGGGKK